MPKIKKRVKDTSAYFKNWRDGPCGHRAFSLFSHRPCGGEHSFACEDAGPFLQEQPLSLRGVPCFHDNKDCTNIDRKYLENFLNLGQISLKTFTLTCDLYDTQL